MCIDINKLLIFPVLPAGYILKGNSNESIAKHTLSLSLEKALCLISPRFSTYLNVNSEGFEFFAFIKRRVTAP